MVEEVELKGKQAEVKRVNVGLTNSTADRDREGLCGVSDAVLLVSLESEAWGGRGRRVQSWKPGLLRLVASHLRDLIRLRQSACGDALRMVRARVHVPKVAAGGR